MDALHLAFYEAKRGFQLALGQGRGTGRAPWSSSTIRGWQGGQAHLKVMASGMLKLRGNEASNAILSR